MVVPLPRAYVHGAGEAGRSRNGNLIAWAKERGPVVRVYRATPWGNPFPIGRDGDRATVIARYRDDHLPGRPDLFAHLGELRCKALGCAALRSRGTRTS